MKIYFRAIHVLWLREMKRFIRARSRIIATLMIPILSLTFLSMGLSGVALPGIPEEIDYVNFLLPGIIGMTILFSAVFSGISVLWDREFGFLKEIMITPVNRVSIVIGRILGSTTIAMIQGSIILFFSMLFIGIKKPSPSGIAFALLFMFLIGITFVGFGLILAARMRDIQGFNLIMNFIIFPMFLLSGAILPLKRLPDILFKLSYLDPLNYGVDGLRASLMKFSNFELSFNLIVLSIIAVITIIVGALMFERIEAY